MGLFKTSEEKMLDSIVKRIEVNMQNNYKDNAQEAFVEFKKAFESYKISGRLKGKSLDKYNLIYDEYSKKLEGYTHKDQKPYWT